MRTLLCLCHLSCAAVPLSLHRSTKLLKLLILAGQPVNSLLTLTSFLGHLEDVLISCLLLPRQVEILLFQTFRLLGHLLHLLAEGQEQVVAVVEGVFYLLWGQSVTKLNIQRSKLNAPDDVGVEKCLPA